MTIELAALETASPPEVGATAAPVIAVAAAAAAADPRVASAR